MNASWSGFSEIQNRTLQNDQETLHERIAGILRQEKLNMTVREYLSSIAALTHPVTPSTSTTPSPTPPPFVNYNFRESINWGVILPIALIGLVLFVFVTCLFWQSWKEKRSMLNYLEHQHNSHENPAYEMTTEVQMPTRSLGAQVSRGSNTFQNVQTFPPGRRQGSRYLFQTEEAARKAGHLPPRLSPIDESVKQKSADITTSMCVGNETDKCRDGTSPFQAAWGGTPTVRYTDNINRRGGINGYENPCFSAPGKLAGNVYCDECNALNPRFYPRMNSPTTEYEMDSEKSVLLTRDDGNSEHVTQARVPHVVNQPPPCLYGEEISSITTFPEASNYPHALGGNCQARMFSRSISECGTLSLPSSISRCHTSHRSNTQNYPLASTRNCSPLRLNFTLSSSIEVSDHCSNNTSLFPCVGSSCTSVWTQAASRPNLLPPFTYDDRHAMLRSTSVPETKYASPDLLPSLVYKESCSGEADLFRTVSLADELSSDSSQMFTSVSCSLSQGTHAHPTPVSADTDTWEQISLEKDKLFENDLVCDLGSLPTKKVKFTVPVLVRKQYWV